MAKWSPDFVVWLATDVQELCWVVGIRGKCRGSKYVLLSKEKQRTCMSTRIEQEKGNALLWCNVPVFGKRKKKKKKRIVYIFTEKFYEALFCSFSFLLSFLIHVLCTFLCAVLITAEGSGWLAPFAVRRRQLSTALWKGNICHCFPFYSSVIFSLLLLFGFI